MRDIRLFLGTLFFAAALFVRPAPALAGTTGVIKGTVSDAQGHPLADARVSVASPSYTGSTTSGGNGFYVITGLPVDTYSVTFSRTGYQAQVIPGVLVVQDQDVRLDAKLEVQVKTLAVIPVRGATSLIQPTVTADRYTINATTFQNLNGTPQDLNGFQAFNSLPGVTTDNFGYPVIRAGQENDVGYEYEGVDNTDPITGQFLNGLSLNGTRSIELSTGGYDVASGNTNSGVINQVIKRGTYPGSGQSTIRLFTPAFGHELSFDWGSATPDNRFSYYLSFGGQRDATTYGNQKQAYPELVAFQDLFTTDDDVANFAFHFGKNNANEIQWLADITAGYFGFGTQVNANSPYATNNFNVQCGSVMVLPCLTGGAGSDIFASDYTMLYPGQVAYRQNIGYIDSQTFNSVIEKLNFKHQFGPSSFLNLRAYRTMENLIFRYPYDAGSFTDFWEDLNTIGNGVGFDYTNQVSSRHQIVVGADDIYYKDRFSAGFPSFQPFDEPLECNFFLFVGSSCYIAPLAAALNNEGLTNPNTGLPYPTDPAHAPMSTYANDFSYSNDPITRLDTYVKDLYQPNDRLTIDAGVRFDQQIYHLPGSIPLLNEFYTQDDAGNFITHLGENVGTDITRPSQISPRLAVSLKLGPNDVVRLSYGKNIEFEPLSAVENTYVVDPALKNCSIASGCLVPLQGYSPTCINGVDPANANAPCNDISNLYQQIIVDQNTNNFAQYTPVRPQRAVNADFSVEHQFGGLELKITPYYRKGTDYVVGTKKLLFTLASGTPVFGPTREINAGINENTGVEFVVQKQSQYGFSGLFDATYDNTLANYDSDFFPSVDAAALAAGHFFHVTYVSPITATVNLNYSTRAGFHISATIPYVYGYRYGVGKKVWVFDPTCPGGPSVPCEVLNTDIARNDEGLSVQDSYYITQTVNTDGSPNLSDTILNPVIIGSRGTPEGNDPGTLFTPPITTVNLSISHDFGTGSNRNMTLGVRVLNLFGNYQPARIINNPFYWNCANFGAPTSSSPGECAPGLGLNPNIVSPGTFPCPPSAPANCFLEPYQYNFSAAPYENEPIGPPRLWTVFFSTKY